MNPSTSPQNIAEFWNVCTRPAAARGGFGLGAPETERRLRLVERLIRVLPDNPATYRFWRHLVARHVVQGVQVHDARLVAWMQALGITHLLTLNPADFARHQAEGIVAETPQEMLGVQPAP